MKKLYTLFLSIFLFTSVSIAQISIVQSDLPNSGDSIRISYASGFIYNPDSAGAGFTWNYYNLVPTIQNMERFASPANTAYPFPFAFTASYGQAVYTPDSLGAVMPTDVYNFFKESSSQFRQVGRGMTMSGAPIPVAYNNADVIYRLPVAFGNIDSCDADYAFNIPNLIYYGETIHRVNMVDGWGDLITPYDTFSVVRLKSTLYITDTIHLDSAALGFTIPRPASYEYKWLAKGKKIPVLQVNATDIAGFPLVNTVWYQDSLHTNLSGLGIKEIKNISAVAVYPNPAKDIIYLEYDLSSAGETVIDITDVTGRNVYSSVKANLSGKNRTVISLSDEFKSGVYFLSVRNAQYAAFTKLIIAE